MRGQTGGTASLGKGCLMSTATTQGINTRSSTETELVALDAMMPQVLWTNYFLDGQSYGAARTVVYQDNKSTILLATNGRASSSKRTKHINQRFYFVKDRIESGEICVEYCPSEEMIADFFTKPLQGALFIRIRDFIMNVKSAPKK
jgi:KUP system potassium uptake protein